MNKYKISETDFVLLEEIIHLEQPYKAGKPWQFAGSFYYATTVLTTIGTYAPSMRLPFSHACSPGDEMASRVPPLSPTMRDGDRS